MTSDELIAIAKVGGFVRWDASGTVEQVVFRMGKKNQALNRKGVQILARSPARPEFHPIYPHPEYFCTRVDEHETLELEALLPELE